MMLKRQSFSLWMSRVLGLGLAYFAILQAWPGRGFWGGGKDGAYPSMASEMGSVSQPGFSASIQHWFQTFTTNSSWTYNTLVVVVLALAAFGFLSGKVSWMRLGTIVYVAMALVDWVLVQDFAVFGGMGTDLNSMIPSALIVGGAYLLARDAKEVVDLEEIPVVRESRDTRTLRFVGAIAATVVFLVGAVPMLLVGVLPGTSADVAAATGAGVQELNSPAPDFTLIDQQGKRFTLSDYRGKTVVLSFLDPVCTSECPIEAQEMKAASQQLGNNPAVEFVAVNSNPFYRAPATLRAFDTAEGLTGWNQWQFLTGTKAQLQTVWDAYGVGVQVLSGGGMVAHAEPIYVINSSGVLTATWTAVAEGSVNSLNSQSAVSLIVSEVQKASK
ncbi:MAG: SCO family protein [Actinomycetes bacterium]